MTSNWKSRFKKKFFIESGVIPVEQIMELELFIEREIEKEHERTLLEYWKAEGEEHVKALKKKPKFTKVKYW